VTALIDLLRNSPNQMPELIISPRALLADLKQFEPEDKHASASGDEWEDPLVELLRRGATLEQQDFMAELQQQRN
jgi:hypothetical protein